MHEHGEQSGLFETRILPRDILQYIIVSIKIVKNIMYSYRSAAHGSYTRHERL